MVGLDHYLLVSGVLFALGLVGVALRRSALVTLMCLEMTLNAANLAAVAFSHYLGRAEGQILVFFTIVIAAAEVAVGLAIFVALFRQKQTVSLDDLTSMRS